MVAMHGQFTSYCTRSDKLKSRLIKLAIWCESWLFEMSDAVTSLSDLLASTLSIYMDTYVKFSHETSITSEKSRQLGVILDDKNSWKIPSSYSLWLKYGKHLTVIEWSTRLPSKFQPRWSTIRFVLFALIQLVLVSKTGIVHVGYALWLKYVSTGQ